MTRTRTRTHARILCTQRLRVLGITMVVVSVMQVVGCGADDTAKTASDDPPAAAKVDQDPVDQDPMVGYDLRRLRPREDEPLADMFERVRVNAIGEHKRVAVLFSADWCEPCRHLDLELGNTHPASMIGGVRILELKEDDWAAGARMDEYNALRRRWEPVLNTYPLLLLLDDEGKRVEEMKDAKLRLEAAGVEPTLPMWFEGV
jgi:thiol-disulfide isomerase/thioredoxin